jgi:hypothetical protein
MPTSHPTFTFTKYVNIHENVDIDKSVDVHTHVFGNLGMANAVADAYGPNTASETITESHAIQGFGSSAASESVSATSGYHFSIW